MTDKLIIITGPTASGKSDLAVGLAQKLNTEIISADSQQIYQGMNIGTNTISQEEMEGVPHHLLSFLSPKEDFSVEEYSKLAKKLIGDLNKEGKIPILVGGTGLYLDSIIYDINYGESPMDTKVREKYQNLAEERGRDYVYQILMEKDPETAEKYHPNELSRVIRALETIEITGQRPSELRKGWKRLNSSFDPVIFFVNFKDRDKLYEKINKRVIQMMDQGLEEEFRNLLNKYDLDRSSKSLAAIGYREFFDYFDGEYSKADLVDLIQKNSRHYAKRQITWMKRYLEEDFSYLIYRDLMGQDEILDFMEEKLRERNFI